MRISDNGRYLVDEDGKPFFYLADTAWRLFFELSREEAEEYLLNRKEKGFTVIMCSLLMEAMKNSSEKFSNYYGNEPMENHDPSRLNVAFFEHVDYVINKANELGLCVALLPAWGEFVGPLMWGEGPVIFNQNNAFTYGKYIGNRYGDKNIIWVLGGDRNPENDEYLNVWRAMARGLNAGDDNRCLMTYHPCPDYQGRRVSSGDWVHNEPWLDFNMMQTSTRWDFDNYSFIMKDYNRAPVKPVLDGETRYENSHEFFYKRPPTGRRITAHQVRKAAYNALLSGAMGHTYGSRDIFCYYVPTDIKPLRDVSVFWKNAMNFPGAFHMGNMKKLFLDYPWFKLNPVQDKKLVVYGCEDGAIYTPAAISADKDFALVYIPEKQQIYVDMNMMAGTSVSTLWFNPRNGTYSSAESFGHYDSFTGFIPPEEDTDSDYVLVLKSDIV